MLKESAADMSLIQEMKVKAGQQQHSVEQAARRLNSSAAVEPCIATDAEGASA